jgi:hypothetical protein
LKGEICDHPTVLERVIQNYRVTKVVCVAEIPELALAHEGVESKSRDQISVGLIENTDRGVDSLDIVIRSHVAVGVGRMSGSPILEVQSFEVGSRRWRRCVDANVRRRGGRQLLTAFFRSTTGGANICGFSSGSSRSGRSTLIGLVCGNPRRSPAKGRPRLSFHSRSLPSGGFPFRGARSEVRKSRSCSWNPFRDERRVSLFEVTPDPVAFSRSEALVAGCAGDSLRSIGLPVCARDMVAKAIAAKATVVTINATNRGRPTIENP